MNVVLERKYHNFKLYFTKLCQKNNYKYSFVLI
jgi:hypothetical protein